MVLKNRTVGGSIGLKESFKVFILCLPLGLFWLGLSSDIPLFSSQYFVTVIGISIFPLLFSSPSAYCHFGVTVDHVEKVVEILKNKGVFSGKSLTSIKNNIEIFENRVKQRILFLRSILALWWAVFLFLTTKYADKFFMEKAQDAPIEIGGGVLFVFFLLLGYVTIESYSKGSSLLFKTILFGLNELEGSREEEADVSLGSGQQGNRKEC